MALNTLKPREVHAAKIGDLSDGGGLWLRVGASGSSWVLRYTAPSGRRREMGLGPAARGSLAQAGESLTSARRSAHDAREQLRQGIDPISLREQRRKSTRAVEAARRAEQERERWTLARAARDYHQRVIEPTRSLKHAAQWIASLENHMPASLWHRPVDQIEAPELLRGITGIKPHARARNLTEEHTVAETIQRIRQRLDTVFEDAVFHQRCTSNPAAAVKRKLREAMPRKQTGQFAALPYREAPELMSRLRAAQGTAARCLEFAMLTAARTSEVLLAEWTEFDLEARLWIVPADRMKGGEAHAVFLSPRAVELVQAQRQLGQRYVFPSSQVRRETSPMSNMAMLKVLERLGFRGRTTVHGLCRSTFSTWANETGAARPDVIEACLAHSEGDKVRAAYNRAEFHDERRALLEAWALFLERSASNVVPLFAA